MSIRTALAAVARQLLIVIAFGLVALAVAFTLVVWWASAPADAADPDQRCDACQPAEKASPRPEPTVVGLPAPEPSPEAPRDVPARTLPPTDTAPRIARRCPRCRRPTRWNLGVGGWWCDGCEQRVFGPVVIRPTVERVSVGPGYRPAVRPGGTFLERLRCALTDHDRVTDDGVTRCLRCKRVLWLDRDRRIA